MKLSQIFDGMSSIVEKFANVGGLLHMASPFIGAMKGGQPADDAKPIVKLWYGMLGLGDEQALEILLQKLEKDITGSRERLESFLRWHFKTGNWVEKGLTIYYGNKFRTFVTKMGSSEGHLIKTIETTVTTPPNPTIKGKSTKAVTKKEIRSSGTNHAYNFLKMMVDTIGNTTPKEKGYKKLLLKLESLNYPHVPKGSAKAIEKVVQATIAFGPVAHAKAIAELTKVNDAIVANTPKLTWFDKFIDKI